MIAGMRDGKTRPTASNTIVEKYLDTLGLTPGDTLVYTCGHPGMIEGVKERLLPKGHKVEEERFWKED